MPLKPFPARHGFPQLKKRETIDFNVSMLPDRQPHLVSYNIEHDDGVSWAVPAAWATPTYVFQGIKFSEILAKIMTISPTDFHQVLSTYK